MNLNTVEIEALVTIALKGGKRRAHWNYRRFNDLEKKGLTKVVNRGEVYHTHQLTALGIETILKLPDDYEHGFYPQRRDIQKAKEIAFNLRLDEQS